MSDALHRLRTVKVESSFRSVQGMEQLAEQFLEVASECDSSAHEVAAYALRYGVERIKHLECQLARIQGVCNETR